MSLAIVIKAADLEALATLLRSAKEDHAAAVHVLNQAHVDRNAAVKAAEVAVQKARDRVAEARMALLDAAGGPDVQDQWW